MRPKSCDRTRLWISLRLDGELSELESRLLTAHLVRCAECRRYETAVSGATLTLRTEPLVPLEHTVGLPQARRRRLGTLRVASAAAAFAVVALTSVLTLANSTDQQRFFRPASAVRDTEARDLRQLRRAELVQPLPAPRFTHLSLPGDGI